MDIISFNEASTANGRIESFIENPDSTSGIVTVPKVIASGETITIPAGRVAILPNVQIDGVLNIENGGEVFIPSGATLGDLEAQIALKAPLASPAFTDNPTAPTQTAGDNSTKVATTAYVDGKMILGTAVNSTSGTSIDFTGIPSWAKKITVMFSGVSTNGSSDYLIRLGTASGIETAGYLSSGSLVSSGVSTVLYTSGYGIYQSTVGTVATFSGNVYFEKIDGNKWIASGVLAMTEAARTAITAGSKTLLSTLDRIRITTVNGTDTFDAGQINIMYEG